MSYQRKTCEDGVNEWFSAMADFVNIAPNLLKARSTEEFEVWFEKLQQIDPRSIYYYIKEHKSEIPEEYINYVKSRLPKAL